MRLLRVQRENLECNLALGHEQRDDRLHAKLLECLQSMVAVRRQIVSIVTDGDDRIEEPADLFDDRHQPLHMRVGRIALVRGRLDLIDRESREHQGLAAEGVAVAAQYDAAIGFDLAREGLELWAACVLGFGRIQTDRCRRDFLVPANLQGLCHGRRRTFPRPGSCRIPSHAPQFPTV